MARRATKPPPLLALALLLVAPGCGPATTPTTVPDWKTTSVDLAQGQVQLGVRFRWVAERDNLGVVVQSTDGGEALLRIFACGRPVEEMLDNLRRKLRWRLVANDISRRGKVVTFRYWRGKSSSGGVVNAALVLHGPLVVSVVSPNLELTDVIGIAERVRLVLPVATQAGCFPLCDLEEHRCAPAVEDEG